MRNPFKRQPRPADNPTLRERIAATREKFGRTVRIHRALNSAEPKAAPEPSPPVDRAALVNYATFLAWEIGASTVIRHRDLEAFLDAAPFSAATAAAHHAASLEPCTLG